MCAHSNGRNGTETASWRHCCLDWLLRFCVSESFVGEVLNLNTNVILFGKWPRSSPAVRRVFFACFSLFLSDCQLATFYSEVKNRRYPVYLDFKLTKLERGSQQTPYYKILFEAVFGRVFYTNARMLQGHVKHSLLAFQKILTVILLKMHVDQHMKRQVHKMHVFKMFITAFCFIFLIKRNDCFYF